MDNKEKENANEFVDIFFKLDTFGKIKTAAFIGLSLLVDANRPKTPAERIDEWVAAGCVGDPAPSGCTLEDFRRLSEVTPRRTY